MDIEKMQAALSYLKQKKRELTAQQHRMIKWQILAGDEDGVIRGIDWGVNRKTVSEKGYRSRWRKARAVYLQSHPLCVRRLAKGRYVKATVVDHIIPHRGDRKLFWDRDNWQALCKSCHDSKTMTEDRYEEFRYPEGRSKSL